MSEYQYYEFVALDRALDRGELNEVRAISSRAELTPHSFVNEYEWGDFKGDPYQFLEKYYDAMLYFANWGTRRFMVKVPPDAIDRKAAKAYCGEGEAGLMMKATPAGLIFDFASETEEPEDWDEMEVKLAPLLPVREDLAGGDLRPLYLGWLAGVAWGRGEKEVEPPVPAGLSQLSGAQQALVDFLRIDEDLLDAAAKVSGKSKDQWEGIDRWVEGLAESKKNKLLVELCTGEPPAVAAKLKREFAKGRKQVPAPTTGGRTVGQLLRESGLYDGDEESE